MKRLGVRAYILLLTCGTVVFAACAQKEPLTSKDDRSNEYALLFAGLRLADGSIISQLYSDSATTAWEENAVRGLDNIATNWKNILVGAKVEQVVRITAKTETLPGGIVRDSGRIVFRLPGAKTVKSPRDSALSFVTRWRIGGSPRRWQIIADTIRP